MMPEKLSPIQRALAAASAMSIHDSRRVVKLICEAGVRPKQQTEGERHYSKREKLIKRTKSSVDRILDYAKHETLRKIEKHFRSKPPITGAEDGAGSDPSGTLAERLTFNQPDFTEELLAALRSEAVDVMSASGQQLLDEIGSDDPWTMPSGDSTAFLDARENLLKGVPDEIHTQVMVAIKDGLQSGDTAKELMTRIRSKFSEISEGSAETIANTETAAAFNYARNTAMTEAGVTHKRWLHSQSPLIKEPRDTHVEHDGQTVPIDKPFDISGVKFMYPTDDSLGAGPEDIINCHCVAIPESQ